MKTPPWYVLTGGPCSGKTTLLEKLHRMKYATVPEVARELINVLTKKGETARDVWESREMQLRILDRKLELEESAPRNRTVFFDRGVPDSIAYFEVLGMNTENLEKICRNRYRKIFFMEMLPFKNDSARTENKAMASKLDKLIFESYKKLDYDIVKIPAVGVGKRLELVVSGIKSN